MSHWLDAARKLRRRAGVQLARKRRKDVRLKRRTRLLGNESLESRRLLAVLASVDSIGAVTLEVNGTDGDDSLTIKEYDDNGTAQLEFLDANGAPIPIQSVLPSGDPNRQPFLPSLVGVTAFAPNNIIVNLGEGNDSLNIALIDGINATVIDGGGNDSLYVTWFAWTSVTRKLTISHSQPRASQSVAAN